MREILFRGKRTDNGEWVYGYVNETTVCGASGSKIATVINKKPRKPYDDDWWEIDPSTVGQYTGMDDRNDTKIFEGDIVEGNWLGEISRYQICYDKGLASFIGLRGIGYTTFTYDLDEFEIIGNVYDNPELLKGDE